MTGWIDPLGLNALYHFIQEEQGRLTERAARQDECFPKSRLGARYHARVSELGRMMTLIQALQRPGHELEPYKELVNLHADRPDIVRAIADSADRS